MAEKPNEEVDRFTRFLEGMAELERAGYIERRWDEEKGDYVSRPTPAGLRYFATHLKKDLEQEGNDAEKE